MKENSHFCILKNFAISSEIYKQKLDSNERILRMQLRSDRQVQRMLEETLLSCVHLSSISITSIKIDDLSTFITTLLNCNTQLGSIELVNCAE